MKHGFAVRDNKGFYFTFENGYTVSVQIGMGNYCDNHHEDSNVRQETLTRMGKGMVCGVESESRTAEIAIWDDKGEWVTGKWARSGGDMMVEGYLTPEDVLRALNWAKRQGK